MPEQRRRPLLTMAQMACRRLDYSGAGLGNDGWRRVLTYSQLRSLERPYGRRAPTREFDLHLTGNMHKYIWDLTAKNGPNPL